VRPFRFFLLLLFLARPLFALDVPPPPERWFTDRAGIVNTTDAAILDTKLKDFEQQSGAQFIIYVFPSIENEAIEDFTIRCVEKWKVGQKKYDNGLVLFVFVKERKVRVEVGYGLEGSITDAVSSRVIREQIAPHFQQGDYAGGLNAAADELMRRIRTGEKPVEPLQPQGGEGQRDLDGFDLRLALFVLFFILFFVVPLFTRRRSGCGGCIPIFLPFGGGGGGVTFGGGGFSGGSFGGGGGGFSGGGGGFGGGGSTGGW
jgi:uncharacterized protein